MSINVTNATGTTNINATTSDAAVSKKNNKNYLPNASQIDITHHYDKDTVQLGQVKSTTIQKNKGLINKIKHFFTGKDYYKTSTGVKVSTAKNTGEIREMSDGTTIVDGAKDVKVKGTKKADDIYVNRSTVLSVKGKAGSDFIIVENSVVKDVNGGRGKDGIFIENSVAGNVNGGTGDDHIEGINSNTLKINGSWGKDFIATDGGNTEKVKSTSRDDVKIQNNPLNANPDDRYAF